MDQPTAKVCTKCGATKLLEDFPRQSTGRLGRRPACGACTRQMKQAWRRANPDKVAAQKRREKRSHLREYRRRKVVVDAKNKRRSERLASRTPEQVAEDQRRLRPDGLKTCRTCRSSKPLAEYYSHLRRADGLVDDCRRCWRTRTRRRRLDQALTWWQQNGMAPSECTYCGQALNHDGSRPELPVMHIDHIIPVSCGGSDEVENWAPACRSCNCSKGAKPLAAWLTE